MKKSKLLDLIGSLTGTGIIIVVAGLFNLTRLPDYSFANAWNELWDKHAVFAGAVFAYCGVMMAVDLWVAAGSTLHKPSRRKRGALTAT